MIFTIIARARNLSMIFRVVFCRMVILFIRIADIGGGFGKSLMHIPFFITLFIRMIFFIINLIFNVFLIVVYF